MIVGVPKEIKAQEHRVALTPDGAKALLERGHRVLVQEGAGLGAGFEDETYRKAGAELRAEAAEIFGAARLIVKVKEPQASETALLNGEHLLFTYLHLAPNPELIHQLLKSGCTAAAYETVQAPDGSLPLLRPMSEVAGRMAIQAGAHELERHRGGRGVLLAGIPGVRPGKVVILGGGVVGANAAQMAVGLGADVVLMDINPATLAQLDQLYRGRLKTLMSTPYALEAELRNTDLLVGAVLVTGALAPRLVTRAMLRAMPPGSVAVDVAIDQGGCMESSRPTSHSQPTYVEEGVVHYCVANIPGAVPRTSTLGLTNATLPWILLLAEHDEEAFAQSAALRHGLNIQGGEIRHPAVSEAMQAAG